eukprot:TRINITY_DN2586_c0_g2_i7.p1 TRINITY_DN2586_c0_g2~~TRINITY_DN2586_c0_g2_i7.p1  ORF type:complete len:131 (+),score=33.64 TRINITY_DN2586_c0_g2_i7:212-604(+)
MATVFNALKAVVTQDAALLQEALGDPATREILQEMRVRACKDNGQNVNYVYNYTRFGEEGGFYLEYDGRGLVMDETTWWTPEGAVMKASRCKDPKEGRVGFEDRFRWVANNGDGFQALVSANAPGLARFF